MNSEKYFFTIENKNKIRLATPAKLKAPLSKTDRKRVEAALIEKRMECKQTKQELERMKTEIEKGSIKIDQELADDFTSIFSNAKGVTPFMSVFRQQQELMKIGGKNVRYHPMLIRYCLSLASKSKSTYEELWNSGILALRSTRDYQNFINPKTGFSQQVIRDLQ